MLVFAHRGASALAPENTLLAVQVALEHNADGIEIDVQQVGNELVIFHDRLLNRNTNGTGALKAQSIEHLQQLDAGQGQTIPTLWQVLACVRGRCLMNLEIKDIDDISLLVQTIQKAINQLEFSAEQFVISSFDHHGLTEFHRQCSNIKIGALTANKPIGYAEFASQLHAYSVNIEMSVLNQTFIADAKSRNLKVMVYTVDDPQELQQLLDWGVDYVFSNDPAHAMKIIQAARPT